MDEQQANDLLHALRMAAEQTRRNFEFAARHGQPDWDDLAGTFEVLEEKIGNLQKQLNR